MTIETAFEDRDGLKAVPYRELRGSQL
jgi:hypothetical protein